MSSCVRATPTWRGAWRRMRPHWMKWPRRCSTCPKKKDCSQPRDANPYPSGSTSSSHRRREPGEGVRLLHQPMCIESCRGDVVSALLTPHTRRHTGTTRICPGPWETARQQGTRRTREESSTGHPAHMSRWPQC